MAVTQFQSDILKLLAASRRAEGISYVAGGVALNVVLESQRLSHDIDLFHDAGEAVVMSWQNDRQLMLAAGYQLEIIRETPTFIEACAMRSGEQTLLQWVRDSAFRFFPLLEHPLLGLTLHPFDLATNKVLAMAGRLEVRDWVDLLHAHANLQALGLLIWAACGKDPGYNPASLHRAIARHHYSQAEVNTLAYEGALPDAAILGKSWHTALAEAQEYIALLPPQTAGHCLLTQTQELFHGSPDSLRHLLQEDRLLFHYGTLGGVWPNIK